MKINEFTIIFNRMCKYFNKDEFINDKSIGEIYYNEMKKINDRYDYFEELLYSKCKFFPKVTEIKDVRYKMNENESGIIDVNAKICECANCNGTGYRIIFYNKNIEYVVACDCKNGDNKLYDGRSIKDKAHRSSYIVPRYSEKLMEEPI
jgi:hypothetical protein